MYTQVKGFFHLLMPLWEFSNWVATLSSASLRQVETADYCYAWLFFELAVIWSMVGAEDENFPPRHHSAPLK